MLARAELHGIPGVLHERLVLAGAPLEPSLGRELTARALARSLDHDAHLAMLRRIDEALAGAGLSGVALKGALLAERLYPAPSSRATSDIDLLVPERDLDAAAVALAGVGYVASDAPSEARFRLEHHHLHFAHAHAMPLELHFHAYRGFGRTLRGEPLVARSVVAPGLRAVRVLEPADELVYLAVHAAAHRFVRLGWLYDLALLVPRLSAAERATADERAREAGFARPFAMALELVSDLLGVDARTSTRASLVGRATLLRRVVGEPRAPVARSATRFAYTLLLCDSWASARDYATLATRSHVRRLLGAEP